MSGEIKGLDVARHGPSTSLGTNGEEVSRRAVLGAAVALPFLPLEGGGQVGVAVGPGAGSSSPGSTPESTPSLPSPIEREGSSWHEALAAYRAAEAGVEAAGRVCSAVARDEIGAAEDAYGDRIEEMFEALRRLLVLPAPDVASFLVKVDAAFEHEIATLAGGEPCVAAMRGEALRLRSGQAGRLLVSLEQPDG